MRLGPTSKRHLVLKKSRDWRIFAVGFLRILNELSAGRSLIKKVNFKKHIQLSYCNLTIK